MQTVPYPDKKHLAKQVISSTTHTRLTTSKSVLATVASLPPLVVPSEIERLRFYLAQVQRNDAFLIHAGDCAEAFDACTQQNISAKIGLILSFSLVLIWGARLPVVRIGRIAGQYAKPRSSPYEQIGDRQVLSFRGDIVNGFDPNDRTPDPERLLQAYFYSATTLNYIRTLLASGFASLHHPRDWSLAHVRSPSLRREFESIVASLSDALDFSRTIGGLSGSSVDHVDFYTSHEGLLLDYERAMTRSFPVPGTPEKTANYNTSAHFLWVGDRTRQLDGEHVHYFRTIRNPMGIKVGPTMKDDELVSLLDIVNPDKEMGRVTLITRYGASKIGDHLPGHIKAVQKSGHPVAWICDPMHGNTLTSSTGVKTRNFGTIISELTSCFSIHATNNSTLNGISLEFTGEINDEGFSVTECLGGSMELAEEQLGLRYQSFCDPRLNFEQSLDLAFLIANYLKKQRRGELSTVGDMFAELGGVVSNKV